MNQYLIPANSKKGQLIFNLFRLTDLIVLIVGGFITLIFMFAFPGDSLFLLILKLLPISICALLVMPVPYYHNVLVFLEEMFMFLLTQYGKEYHWKGWCAFNVINERKK